MRMLTELVSSNVLPVRFVIRAEIVVVEAAKNYGEVLVNLDVQTELFVMTEQGIVNVLLDILGKQDIALLYKTQMVLIRIVMMSEEVVQGLIIALIGLPVN